MTTYTIENVVSVIKANPAFAYTYNITMNDGEVVEATYYSSQRRMFTYSLDSPHKLNFTLKELEAYLLLQGKTL